MQPIQALLILVSQQTSKTSRGDLVLQATNEFSVHIYYKEYNNIKKN